MNHIRYLLSVCFVFSGTSKLLGLHAFENEIILYGDAYVGNWMLSYSWIIAILICLIEVIVGIMLIFRVFPIFFNTLLLIILCCFTYLVSMNLLSPPATGRIESCDCFGEFIRFGPLSSFIKNVILLGLTLLNFHVEFNRSKNKA